MNATLFWRIEPKVQKIVHVIRPGVCIGNESR